MQRELGAGLMLRKGGIDADGQSTEGARHQKPSGPQVITAEEGETGTVMALETPAPGLQMRSRGHASVARYAQTAFVSFELRYAGCEEGHDGYDDSLGGSCVPAA
jgi:hypothetical protein